MNAWSVPGYREERELGSGATGRVVLATYVENGGRAAIKYLSDELSSDASFRVAFRDEARRLAEIADPNIARVYGYVESHFDSAVVMEFVDGVPLSEVLRERGALSPEAALVVLKGSLLGLSAAHDAGIVHRDYKPGNVLVRADGSVKLTDFGIAVAADPGMPAGTPLYMAPEQWNGAPAAPATDLYAATCVLFECLTGHVPYDADHVATLRQLHQGARIPVDGVPDPLLDLVIRGLAKNPANRPTTARAFMGELERAAYDAYGPQWEHRGHRQLAEPAAPADRDLWATDLGFPPDDRVLSPAESEFFREEPESEFFLEEREPRTSTGSRRAVVRRPRRYGTPILIAAGVVAVGAVAAVLAVNRDTAPTSQISAEQARPGGATAASAGSATPAASPAHTRATSPAGAGGSSPAPASPAPASPAPASPAPASPAATSAAPVTPSDLKVAEFDGRTATVRVKTPTSQSITLTARFAEGPSPSKLTVSGRKTFELDGSTSYHRSIAGGFAAPDCGQTVYRQVTIAAGTPVTRARSKVVEVTGDPCPAPAVDKATVDWDGRTAQITVRTDGPGEVHLAAEFTRREKGGPAKVVSHASRTLSGDTTYNISLPGHLGTVDCGETAYFGVKVTTDPAAANGPQTEEVQLFGSKCGPPTVSIASWNGSTLSVKVTNASPDPVTLTADFRQTVTAGRRTVQRNSRHETALSGNSAYNQLFTVRFATPQCGYADVRDVVVNVSSALGAASDSASSVHKSDACDGAMRQPTGGRPVGKPARGLAGRPGDKSSARSDDRPRAESGDETN
ncbi:hypothetical protein GCM10023194_58130 [Planotetraspora phitsanulokensis]|uniref:non-specific serine/threonine protein kinase n=1 Tax=Planotetraspora phitsanulokensis TaxID=575192 RepID=A0A8J3UBF1_9ACTN|nr:serine/threonine-protein kinase [Planotetraspora phitsanulokensis]GII40276.1 hypothetical protein Pph01_52790 [Planotetraspora phitsanulokensis]